VKWLYVRWAGIAVAGIVIALLGAARYETKVKPITPEQLLGDHPAGTVRMIGLVQPGSLTLAPGAEASSPITATFELVGQSEHLPVRYTGPAEDNLRELKTLVVIGRFDPANRTFEAAEIDLLPNYGFITAAYLVTLLPLGLFLFGMERRVALLYTSIKETTVYQPEAGGVDQG
jgi:cytochrome c-type biogenesis protein CcmE